MISVLLALIVGCALLGNSLADKMDAKRGN